MGCLSSKPSTDHQQLISPTNTKIHDAIMEFTPPKQHHDHSLTVQTTVQTNNNLKIDDTLDRCSSFHTVKEYDELLERITDDQNDAHDLAEVILITETADSASNNDMMNEKKQDTEFQTVPSLRQWLHAPAGGGHGSGGGDGVAGADHFTTTKVGFSFYENHSKEESSVLVKSTGKEEGDESIVELVAAFDKYMEQLQIDEDNILKQIDSQNLM